MAALSVTAMAEKTKPGTPGAFSRWMVELPGEGPVPVTAQQLAGAERARAWERIVAAQPRLGKYQSKSDVSIR